jgi:GT2 family glycosyltransferase
MVRADFPIVTLIANGENLGIRARNLGYKAVQTPVVLSLDDDIELADPHTLERIAASFADAPALGALTLKICEEETGDEYVPAHWWHPRPRETFQDREFNTDTINEAAVAFRVEALAKAGYYLEVLFWGGEEMDLSLGILDAGYALRYAPVPVMHLAPRGNLNVKADYRHALLVRNRFWVALRRLPLGAALSFIAPRMLLWAVRSLRYGYFGYYLRGLFDFARMLPDILRERVPISADTRARLQRIRAGRDG